MVSYGYGEKGRALEITQIYLGYQNGLRVFWRCLPMKFEVVQLISIIHTKKEDYAIRMD